MMDTLAPDLRLRNPPAYTRRGAADRALRTRGMLGGEGRQGERRRGWRQVRWRLVGCPVHCMCEAGVTHARGCSTPLWAAFGESPCQKCSSRTHRVHVAASAAQGRGGRAGWKELEGTEEEIEDCGRFSWCRQVEDAFGGLTCLTPLDAGCEERLQPLPFKGTSAGFNMGF
ncbi:hypothetical protein JOQ06_017998 [Pogonophryne albipinna]|uniref:Uncharacterized protein n=1 Tax=Pogonophryne albipinna TaxID=1090488 RepID=A0AAD6AHJ8_9TELE|nr:hypothetical protein JOQ06_017998 [Pogonophryne albipinna]